MTCFRNTMHLVLVSIYRYWKYNITRRKQCRRWMVCIEVKGLTLTPILFGEIWPFCLDFFQSQFLWEFYVRWRSDQANNAFKRLNNPFFVLFQNLKNGSKSSKREGYNPFTFLRKITIFVQWNSNQAQNAF